MKVRRGDTPYNRAPAAIGRTAYRGLDLVGEVGERLEDGFGKSPHGCPPAGRRLGHGRIIPLDVMSQESDEFIEISRVPRIHEPLGHIC
jgi:hypothetical protein